MKNIPIVMCIDVEPKEREIDSDIAKDWAGFEETVHFFSDLRLRLEQATGSSARFSWFFRMDPQVEHTYGVPWWVVLRYPETVKRLETAGDDLGLHTHPWRWDRGLDKWVIDQCDQDWIDQCVRTSFAAFRHVFRRDCHSFRFGDRWMNNETVDLLDSLGVKFDLTLEPGRYKTPVLKESHTGSLPDYRAVPTWPYRPARDDFRKRGGKTARQLWVVPLSTGRSWVGRFAGLERMARALGINLHPHQETTPLFFNLPNPLFRLMTNELLAVWRKVILVPVLRSDAGASSACMTNMQQNAAFLLSHPLINRFRFVTPHHAIELLT
jgi:hypothetical protein